MYCLCPSHIFILSSPSLYCLIFLLPTPLWQDSGYCLYPSLVFTLSATCQSSLFCISFRLLPRALLTYLSYFLLHCLSWSISYIETRVLVLPCCFILLCPLFDAFLRRSLSSFLSSYLFVFLIFPFTFFGLSFSHASHFLVLALFLTYSFSSSHYYPFHRLLHICLRLITCTSSRRPSTIVFALPLSSFSPIFLPPSPHLRFPLLFSSLTTCTLLQARKKLHIDSLKPSYDLLFLLRCLLFWHFSSHSLNPFPFSFLQPLLLIAPFFSSFTFSFPVLFSNASFHILSFLSTSSFPSPAPLTRHTYSPSQDRSTSLKHITPSYHFLLPVTNCITFYALLQLILWPSVSFPSFVPRFLNLSVDLSTYLYSSSSLLFISSAYPQPLPLFLLPFIQLLRFPHVCS